MKVCCLYHVAATMQAIELLLFLRRDGCNDVLETTSLRLRSFPRHVFTLNSATIKCHSFFLSSLTSLASDACVNTHVSFCVLYRAMVS